LKNRKNLWVSFLFCAVLLSLFFVLTATASETKKVEKKNLATFIKYETAFSKSLVDLKNNLGKLVNPEKYQKQIPEIAKQIDQLDWQIQMAKTDLNMPAKHLSVFDAKLVRQELVLKKIDKPLTKSIQQLSDWEVEWSKKKQELIEWQKSIPPKSTFALVLDNIGELRKTTDGALKIISDKLYPAIETGQEISKLQVKTYVLMAAVDELIGETKAGGFDRTLQPIFSPAFFHHFNLKLLQVVWESTRNSLRSMKNILGDHPAFFLCNLLGIILLAAGIKYMGRNINPSDKCYPFTQKPVSVSLFFFLIFYLIFHFALIGNLIILEPILQIFLSFSVILFATIFTAYSPAEKLLFRLFAILLIITWIFRIITLPVVLMQLFIAASSLCMICYCLWRSRVLLKKKIKGIRITGLRLLTVFFTVTCAGMILGYEQFSLYTFSSLLIGVVAAHVVALIYLIVNGALELILLRIPSRLVQVNRTAIVDSLAPIVGFICGTIYLFVILREWQIYPSREAVAEGLLSMGFTLGGLKFSLEPILLTVGTIYVVLLISKAIQNILLDSIFPRYRVELGVQLSMVRLIHYSVLVVGFIILLNILGFELTKLTILGGALGVGIGFGLQAIVNNFASGLILLFERPIKVGDTIEIGNDFGEVKKLGLRATVVSTFDNAEIVIPNSDLITAPVTNWTLSGRQARVKVPVGVAYGSDIQKVLEILMSCAKEHPMVLSEPQPRALFLAFGASSLDIELRVWTPDFSNRRLLHSELNQEINNEFSLAGIEIPFPQTDLHLRSVDNQAAATFNGYKSQTS
jgi:potassium efflux system protein